MWHSSFARLIKVLASRRSCTVGSFNAPCKMLTPATNHGQAYVLVHCRAPSIVRSYDFSFASSFRSGATLRPRMLVVYKPEQCCS